MVKEDIQKTQDSSPVTKTEDKPEKEKTATGKKPKALAILSIVILVLLFAIAGVMLWLDQSYAKKFYPGTKIGKINVGNLSFDDARDLLDQKIQDYLKTQNITLSSESQSFKASMSDLGVKFDVESTIKKINFHSEGLFERTKHQLAILLGIAPKNNFSFSLNREAFDNFLYRVDQEVSTPYKNPQVVIGKKTEESGALDGYVLDKIKTQENIEGDLKNLKSGDIKVPMEFISPKVKAVDAQRTSKLVVKIAAAPIKLVEKDSNFNYTLNQKTLLSWLSFREYLYLQNQNHKKLVNLAKVTPEKEFENNQQILHLSEIVGIPGIKYGLKIEIDKEKLAALFQDFEEKLNIEPTNATLAFNNNQIQIIKSDVSGWSVDLDGLKADLEEALNSSSGYRKVIIRMKELRAAVRLDNLDELGIKKLISTGASNFSGSPRNRMHNIRVGASKFNGALIKPGEEFSFNELLGPVDGSTGYLPELVIKEDKTVPEFGGGLCQVSTTMFRAALYAGLPVTARRNHAYPVRYYKWPFLTHGTDATVYPGSSDLKFINDTGNWILIQARISGTLLYFDFFGNLDPERKVEITTSEYDHGYRGAGSLRATAIVKIYEGGVLKRTDKYQSNYKSPNDFPHPKEDVDKKKENPPPPTPPPAPPPAPPGG